MRSLSNVIEGMFDVDSSVEKADAFDQISSCFTKNTKISGDVDDVFVTNTDSYPQVTMTDPITFDKLGVKKLTADCNLDILSSIFTLSDLELDVSKTKVSNQGLFINSQNVKLKNVKIEGHQTISSSSRFYADGCEFTHIGGDVRFLYLKVYQFKNCKINADVLCLREIPENSGLYKRFWEFVKVHRNRFGPLEDTMPAVQEHYKNLSLSDLIGTKDVNKWNVNAVELCPASNVKIESSLCFFSQKWWDRVRTPYKEWPIQTKDGWYTLYGLNPTSYIK